jgi:hypothetical protein
MILLLDALEFLSDVGHILQGAHQKCLSLAAVHTYRFSSTQLENNLFLLSLRLALLSGENS